MNSILMALLCLQVPIFEVTAKPDPPPQVFKPTQQAPVVHPPKKRYLAMFTASYCGPCQQDKRTVVPQIERAGFLVKPVDMANRQTSLKYSKRINSFPSYVACDWETGEWVSDVHVGRIDLATAKRMLDTPATQSTSGQRFTRSELDTWVRANYTRSTELSTGMVRNSEVWSHLVSHDFTSGQVNGLDQWVALALHDAVHAGKISPFRK